MDEKSLIFIKHILENIEKIESFIKNTSKEELSRDELKQYAVIRAIEIVGEASKNISQDTKNKNPDISWKKMIGARDIIIHRYFGVDLEIIWNIIKKDLPELKKQLQKIVK